jgi:predicted metallopeptidase
MRVLPRGIALACLLLGPAMADAQAGPTGPMEGCNALQPVTAAAGSGEQTIESVVQSLRGASYPELQRVDLRVKTFHSKSDFLRTRFSLPRFFLPLRMRYFVQVNPEMFQQQAPADGVCSIVAHELAHVVALSHGNRIRRLRLVKLISRGYTARFERGTDLAAIHRGYAEGLKSYRSWLYVHIPPDKVAEKRRNYFSPQEIERIEQRLLAKPELFELWSKRVPMNLQEIEAK